MEVHRAYCSAVDRNVPVVVKPGAAPRDPGTLQDPSDLICLDYKVRCTGWCCPLYSVSDAAPAEAGRAPAPSSADRSSRPARR